MRWLEMKRFLWLTKIHRMNVTAWRCARDTTHSYVEQSNDTPDAIFKTMNVEVSKTTKVLIRLDHDINSMMHLTCQKSDLYVSILLIGFDYEWIKKKLKTFWNICFDLFKYELFIASNSRKFFHANAPLRIAISKQ